MIWSCPVHKEMEAEDCFTCPDCMDGYVEYYEDVVMGEHNADDPEA